MDGWMDGWTDRWMAERKSKSMNGYRRVIIHKELDN